MTIIWGAAIIVFLIIEAATVGLASIWFALGAAAALISELCGAPIWLQIIWFVVVSGVTLCLTRPLAAKYVNAKRQPTNADRIIGAEGLVLEKIDNLRAQGSVTVDGKHWTARSVGGETIEAGSLVKIEAIEGVKLMVSQVEVSQAETINN